MAKKRRVHVPRQEDAHGNYISTRLDDDWSRNTFREDYRGRQDTRMYYVYVNPAEAGADDPRYIRRAVYRHIATGNDYTNIFGYTWAALERYGVTQGRIFAEERRQRRHLLADAEREKEAEELAARGWWATHGDLV